MTWKMTDVPSCVTVAAETREVYQNYLHSYYISSITILSWKMPLYASYKVLDFQFHLIKSHMIILGMILADLI